MYTIPLLGRGDFSEWRDAARMLAAAGISPREADWRVCGLEEELFEAVVPPPLPKADGIAPPLTVPPGFLPLAEAVSAIRSRAGIICSIVCCGACNRTAACWS